MPKEMTLSVVVKIDSDIPSVCSPFCGYFMPDGSLSIQCTLFNQTLNTEPASKSAYRCNHCILYDMETV